MVENDGSGNALPRLIFEGDEGVKRLAVDAEMSVMVNRLLGEEVLLPLLILLPLLPLLP